MRILNDRIIGVRLGYYTGESRNCIRKNTLPKDSYLSEIKNKHYLVLKINVCILNYYFLNMLWF